LTAEGELLNTQLASRYSPRAPKPLNSRVQACQTETALASVVLTGPENSGLSINSAAFSYWKVKLIKPSAIGCIFVSSFVLCWTVIKLCTLNLSSA